MARQVHPEVEAMVSNLNSDEVVDLVFVCDNGWGKDVADSIAQFGGEVKSVLPSDVLVAEVTVSDIPKATSISHVKSVSPDREARALA
ncbi:hypothetical protein [Haloferax larsenii]|uniref:Putative peptidase inhibitor domain-containing protein n=1 Tax=Haloferax larsenii TaxID=302484 RepID=A0A1H7L8H0_HALLR|nr:hypothetical protein [Haloferax larsenii]UVE51324.1 hypothetical protein KU306_05435 [Haloferax larsenii]SEK95292.1 hypothetical protein SAMN04488691_102246 [Haloferax larsenii]